jgi:hypothetical protein
MKTLQTFRLKPNPAGKDKNPFGKASTAQLGAEWVDIKNTGSSAVMMEGVKLYHVAFVHGKASHWELIMSFKGTLGVGEIVRIHSGHGPVSLLNPEDRDGATYHIFTDRDQYVWNNAEGDTSRITETSGSGEVETDKAGYDPHPPEGVILVRSGDKLVPISLAAMSSLLALGRR